eukprot:CAMPEP_0185751904 /NCGR_PEP_ID=MMETSP1174-20130828/10674_1 /TAXON_ID=35687 /ORGANISM="Dictyocha speculum, Strain CCMP1381" /LENGTH=490 /DNA_ID=CAMNT_0028429093 /DNA_START=56 /DNA_END=1528 /DNA_ORIENTATION=+
MEVETRVEDEESNEGACSKDDADKIKQLPPVDVWNAETQDIAMEARAMGDDDASECDNRGSEPPAETEPSQKDTQRGDAARRKIMEPVREIHTPGIRGVVIESAAGNDDAVEMRPTSIRDAEPKEIHRNRGEEDDHDDELDSNSDNMDDDDNEDVMYSSRANPLTEPIEAEEYEDDDDESRDAAIHAVPQDSQPMAHYQLRQINGPIREEGNVMSLDALCCNNSKEPSTMLIGRRAVQPEADPMKKRSRPNPVEPSLLFIRGIKAMAPVILPTLPGTDITIGRSGNVSVDDVRVSRRHVLLQLRDTGWLLTDTSTNGTVVNGKRVKTRVPVTLSHGSVITLGNHSGSGTDPDGVPLLTFQLHLDSPIAMSLAAKGMVGRAPNEAISEQMDRKDPVEDVPQLKLNHVQVSRRHCELRFNPTSMTFHLRDLTSMNGVFVNRVKLQRDVFVPVAVNSEFIFGGQQPWLPVGSRLRRLDDHVFAFRLERAGTRA